MGDAAKAARAPRREKGLELACDIAADVPEALVGDAGRLRQVLLNVLGNAVKFTTEGEVVLRVDGRGRSAEARATLHFSVRDTGIGIPPEKQAADLPGVHPGRQLDDAPLRRHRARPRDRAPARRADGRPLWVESEVGRGSTFHFTAVFDRRRPPSHPTPSSSRQALDGLRVLVVDDNATNRRILEEMLASWHMKPTAVGDAPTAMAALRKAPTERAVSTS